MTNPQIERVNILIKETKKKTKMEGKIKIGPAGKKDYRSPTMVNWDEGSHNGIISQIFLSHGSGGIYSIQFQFMLDDKFVLSDHHGQHIGSLFDVVSLFILFLSF